MTLDSLTLYFSQYGLIAIFIIVFLEYLNLPGFPAGIIMPLTGVMAAKGEIAFLPALAVSIGAGLCGSWLLYLVGRKGGEVFLRFYFKKFPSQQATMEKHMDWLREKGVIGVFMGKLIPAVRTLISIPAGVLKMDFLKYTISSVCGILIWNLVFVGCGYFLGDAVFALFG